MPVFVIDAKGKPLLPTTEVRARLLLKGGEATVFSVEPFTLQLKRVVENPVGAFKVGIDDGSKMVGISIAYGDKVVFAGNIQLRQDVPGKMLQRYQYRRTRRGRKLRHRKARFLNRGKKGWLPPTIRQKKDSILRVIDDMSKRLNITECVVEQGQFDVSSMSAGYKLIGREYQKSEYEGENWRQKVLWRDKYLCQRCGSKERLQAHHVRARSDGGTNSVSNGLTLCKSCHELLHKGIWKLDKKSKQYKYPAHIQQGKWYLFRALKERISEVRICFGWMTAKARQVLGLEKEHYHDASAMIGANIYKCKLYLIKPRRTKVWEQNPTKTCTERNGFKHYDIIKSSHRTRGIVIGSVRSLKQRVITLRTAFDNNFPVSYSKSRLLWRPSGIIYCQI